MPAFHSKCFDQITTLPNKRSFFQGQFLLALQNPLTKLWTLSAVRVTQNQDQSNYEFSAPRSSTLETLEAMEKLAIFEENMAREGATERVGFTYPNTTYFRKNAQKLGVIFDIDTHKPSLLIDGIFPSNAGNFNPHELTSAALEYAANPQIGDTANTSFLDQMLSPYEEGKLELTAVFTNMEIMQAFQSFAKNITLAGKGLESAMRYDSFRYTDTNYSRKENYKFDVDIQKALKACKTLVPLLEKHTADPFKGYYQDVITVFALYADMLELQFSFAKQKKGEEKPNVDKFASDLEKVKARYNVSDEIKNKMGRMVMAGVRYGLPDTLTSVISVLSKKAQELETEENKILDGVRTGKTLGYTLRINMQPPT